MGETMQGNCMGTCPIEARLADLDGLVTALRYIGENADDAELPGLRTCAVSLLYLMGDAIQASQKLATPCCANVAKTPCDN